MVRDSCRRCIEPALELLCESTAYICVKENRENFSRIWHKPEPVMINKGGTAEHFGPLQRD